VGCAIFLSLPLGDRMIAGRFAAPPKEIADRQPLGTALPWQQSISGCRAMSFLSPAYAQSSASLRMNHQKSDVEI
jgi:hypothetical protein